MSGVLENDGTLDIARLKLSLGQTAVVLATLMMGSGAIGVGLYQLGEVRRSVDQMNARMQNYATAAEVAGIRAQVRELELERATIMQRINALESGRR